MTPDEAGILHAILRTYHTKARTKPRNFIRTYSDPANLEKFDAMVRKGWLIKESIPGHAYRVTAAGKAAYKVYLEKNR